MSKNKRGMASESVIQIGILIRDALHEKEMFGQELYNYCKEHSNRKRKGSYASFRANYINKLSKLGLIERTKTEPSSNPFFKNRQYWKITELGRNNRELWINPQLVKKNGN